MHKNTDQDVDSIITQNSDEQTSSVVQPKKRKKKRIGNYRALFTLIAFLIGLGSGYLLGGWNHRRDEKSNHDPVSMAKQINPTGGYTLPANFGDIGPQLLTAGAIDFDKFVMTHAQAGQPLSEEQLSILKNGSDAQIVINQENAYFLLNFFWALGLANENPILTEGPMMNHGIEQVTRFASTGGWTIAANPVIEVYASTPMITLTKDQQVLLEEVATQVYRPCCNNPTHFPDCNHGMAMLGLLELMVAQGASKEHLFEAAKYINAYWYSPQTFELALYFKATENADFNQVDPQLLVGRNFSSATGYQNIRQWLIANGELQQAPGGGSSC